MAEPRIRLGMVGGGEGAFIGAIHRIAARLDDRYELVAGALSASPDKAIRSAAAIGLRSDRSYPDFRSMAQAEAARTDAIEAVAIVTPNHMHAPIAEAFLETNVHIICDKPLTATLEQARRLRAKARATGAIFAVTYNYSGYPLVRHARAMVQAGELGAIRIVQSNTRRIGCRSRLSIRARNRPTGAPIRHARAPEVVLVTSAPTPTSWRTLLRE